MWECIEVCGLKAIALGMRFCFNFKHLKISQKQKVTLCSNLKYSFALSFIEKNQHKQVKILVLGVFLS